MKEAYAIMMSFHKMVFYLCDADDIIQSDHMPIQKVIKNKTKNVLTQHWALEIFSILPHISFQYIKGKDYIITDILCHLQHLGLYKKPSRKKTW